MEQLPEKWAVLATNENIKIIGDFYNSFSSASYDSINNVGKFFHSHNLSSGESIKYPPCGAHFMKLRVPEKGYTEISFDQFKHYILNIEEPIINNTPEDLSYLIDLFKQQQIT